MAKKKKKVPGLNTSSTADISFMLLIFFLVTTSMDTDKGLTRRLPPPVEDENATKQIHENEIFLVRVNFRGQIWASYEGWQGDGDSHYISTSQLREMVKQFVENKDQLKNWPSRDEAVDIPQLGTCYPTKYHVISVQCDEDAPYWVYFDVQNELVAAYNELRDEFSMKRWGVPYEELSDERKIAVRTYYPQKISEAEPKVRTNK